MLLATISIGEVNRKRLLSIASDLQKKTGKRVDFDEVISHLTEACESKQPRQDLWDLFTQPCPASDSKTSTGKCSRSENGTTSSQAIPRKVLDGGALTA